MALFRNDNHEDKFNYYARNRIREAREAKVWAQEELAEKIAWSRVAISDLQRGRTRISVADLMVIGSALEKPVSYFFPGLTVKDGELSAKELELIPYFRGIENEAMEDLLIKQGEQFANATYEAIMKKHMRDMDEQRGELKEHNRKK